MARMSANHKPDAGPSDPLRYQGRIDVGTVAIAKRDTRICGRGEKGVCYRIEPYPGGDARGEGYAFVFERGGYDGFTVDEVDRDLLLTGDVAQTALGYRYSNVLALVEDWRRGVFRTGADAT